MNLLITLLIAVVIFALLWYLVSLLPIPQPFKNIVVIILILIAIIWLIHLAGWLT